MSPFSRRTALKRGFATFLIPIAGCVSTNPTTSPTSVTTQRSCTNSADAIPDLTINNDVDNPYEVSVTARRDGTTVFDRTYEVESLGRVETKKVFTETGTYSVTTAIADGGTTSLEIGADAEWLDRFGVYVGIRSGGKPEMAEVHAEQSPQSKEC